MSRKGFSRRERKGILYLCIAVVVVLAIGPISDATGCTRRVASQEEDGAVLMYSPDSVLENAKSLRISKEERSENHHRSDSISKARKQALKKIKKKKSKKESTPKGNNIHRRSMRDEEL